jgi:Xaa-Pro aminopeptidase
MNSRLNAIRDWIAETNVDAVLLNKPANRFYAAGFTGSAGTVVMTPDTVPGHRFSLQKPGGGAKP